jgi:phosphopantothenoylcysteine decarboxylase / phosphopantothenate---cysteine ligase
VYTDTFERDAYMAHIHLVRRTDLVLLCPATANILNAMSVGIAQDLATTLFLAHDFTKPWLIAPAMNTTMYRHPMTQASLRRLQEIGCEIFGTASGMLACGEVGEGKLEDPDTILAEVLRRVVSSYDHASAHGGKNILITSGGTQEALDPVRILTNRSTGATGSALATALATAGHRVTLLSAVSSMQASHSAIRHLHFTSFADIAGQLEEVLRNEDFDCVIHSAALSDYSPAVVSPTKVDSSGDELVIRLQRNPKLVQYLRSWSRSPSLKVIAFKLTADSPEVRVERRERLFAMAQPDMVIANDMATLPAWESYIRRSDGIIEQYANGSNRAELCTHIVRWCEALL